MEVIFNSDLLVMKIKITYLILSPLVICYFRLILIFDLDQFLGDLPYLWTHPYSTPTHPAAVTHSILSPSRRFGSNQFYAT